LETEKQIELESEELMSEHRARRRNTKRNTNLTNSQKGERTPAKQRRSRSISPVKYGLDKDTQEKIKEKYDYVLEEQAMDWIEEITKENIDHFYESLKSGELLCRVINAMRPNMIKNININPKEGIMEIENIRKYLSACTAFGLNQNEVFDPYDLHSRKDIGAVVKNVHALSKVASKIAPELPKLEDVVKKSDYTFLNELNEVKKKKKIDK